MSRCHAFGPVRSSWPMGLRNWGCEVVIPGTISGWLGAILHYDYAHTAKCHSVGPGTYIGTYIDFT